MNRSAIIIFWSDEDGAFVADVPELPGCTAHDTSQEEALAEAQQAIELWIETAKEFGDPVPVPLDESSSSPDPPPALQNSEGIAP